MKNTKRAFALLRTWSCIKLAGITKGLYDWSMVKARRSLDRAKELL